MAKLKFDKEFINNDKFRNGPYRVLFAPYYDDRKGKSVYIPKDLVKEFGVTPGESVCFARLRSDFKSYNFIKKQNPYNSYNDGRSDKTKLPIPNRVYYKIIEDKMSTPKLSPLEKHKWIKICKENKMLPSYVPLSAAKTNKIALDLKGLTPSMLYLYLSTARNIGEYPAFVKGVVYLVTKLKMNFYAAFVFLSKAFIGNSGHHIIQAMFDRKSRPENMKNIDIGLMIGLCRFVNNFSKYDDRKIFRYDGLCDWHSFNCSNRISKLSKISYLADAQELFNEHITNAIMAPTDEEAIEHVSKRIREKYASFNKEK